MTPEEIKKEQEDSKTTHPVNTVPTTQPNKADIEEKSIARAFFALAA